MDPEPEIYDDMRWLWDLYSVLSASRQSTATGFPERTKLSEINALITMLNIRNEDQIDLIINTIIALDDVFIEDALKKRKQAEDRAKRA